MELVEKIASKYSSFLAADENGRWVHNLTYRFKRDRMLELFKNLKEDPELEFNMLIDITAVDFLDKREPRFDVVYQLLSLTYNHRLTLKIGVDELKPELESVRSLWAGANFLEREVWDMYGITFVGHGDLRRILMYDEFMGHPLRKDYPLKQKQPRVELRVPELRNDSIDLFRDELVSLPTPKKRKLSYL